LLDENGILVPDADCIIQFNTEGNGELIGLDNGDLRIAGSFKSNRRKTYWGRCLVVVRSSRTAGNIKVMAKSEGFPSAEVLIKVI
jgi:beta-galactosidase